MSRIGERKDMGEEGQGRGRTGERKDRERKDRGDER